MATSIGQIVVDLQANTAQFRADLEKASGVASKSAAGIQGAFRSIGGSVTGAISSMVNFRTVLASVLGTGGLGLLIKNALSAGEEIVNMAQRVGISTTALQELGHAARASGASIGDLEQGLTILNRRLGEAQAGEKAALEAFKAIGVDPTKFRDAGEAIGAVSDGLLTLGTEAQRTASQLDLFGKGSSQLTGLLKEGSAGIERLSKAAHELGIVLNPELLKKSKEMSDTLNVLAEVAKTNLMKALIDLGPVVVFLAEKFAELAKNVRYFVELYKDITGTNQNASLEELANRIVDITEKIERLKAVNRAGGPLIADPKELAILEAQRNLLRDLLRTRQAYEANPDRDKKKTPPPDIKIAQKDIDAVEEYRRKLLLLAIPDETARRVVEIRMEMEKLAASVSPKLGDQIRTIGASLESLAAGAPAAEALKKFNAQVEDYRRELEALDNLTPLGKLLQDADTSGTAAGFSESQKQSIKEYVTRLYELKTAQQAAADATKAATDDDRAYGASVDDLKAKLRAQGEAILNDVLTPLEAYEEKMRTLEKLKPQIGLEAYERAAIAAGKELNRLTTGPANDLIQSLSEQREILGLSAREQAQWNAALSAAGTPTQEQTERIKEQAGALFDLRDQQAAAQRFSDLSKSLEDQAAMFAMTEREAAQYNAQLRLGVGASQEQIAAIRDQAGALFDLAERYRLVNGAIQAVSGAAAQLGAELYDTLVGQQDDLGEAVKRIIHSLNKMILTMIIAEIVARALRAALGGIGTGGADSASSAGVSSTGADITRGAKGGVVKARPGGKLMIVGEAGSDEAIIPLDQMAQVGGGGSNVTVVNEIHNHTDSRVTTQQSQGADGRLINKIIIKAMNSALSDGSTDNAMKNSYGLRRVGVSR